MPFWFSMEHCWTVLSPFWLSPDDMCGEEKMASSITFTQVLTCAFNIIVRAKVFIQSINQYKAISCTHKIVLLVYENLILNTQINNKKQKRQRNLLKSQLTFSPPGMTPSKAPFRGTSTFCSSWQLCNCSIKYDHR